MDAARLKDLKRFYRAIDTLRKALGGPRILAQCNGKLKWPERGVYFFMEEGELRSNTGKGARIVRVGTHALKRGAKTTLWRRLSQHRGSVRSGAGNHRSSIFRLLVGTALIKKHNYESPTWASSKSSVTPEMRSAERPLECRVSSAIGVMPFVWLPIEDEPGPVSKRGFIERNAIALLSNLNKEQLDSASELWLGHFCDRSRVNEFRALEHPTCGRGIRSQVP